MDKLSNPLDDLDPYLTEKPIADLFLGCTVLFADIEGFSAWSSERKPTEVFTLLETIFQTFDRLARKRNVFKVETIGSSYVAVTGLPEAQSDHAIRMCRFARDCRTQAALISKSLEARLGPGTADLCFCFGLHSGPITAGVLRGEKTRFHLFGDTVNTASRMESTSEGNRIQLSESTAEFLVDQGNEEWLQLRPEPVNVKGKGIVKTYWMVNQDEENMPSNGKTSAAAATTANSSISGEGEEGGKGQASLSSSGVIGTQESGSVFKKKH